MSQVAHTVGFEDAGAPDLERVSYRALIEDTLRNAIEFETYVFNVGRELLRWQRERAEVEIP